MLYKLVLIFESVDEIQRKAFEQYFSVMLFVSRYFVKYFFSSLGVKIL